MKIRNSSRITAIVLALVMLLPLISIPTFAEVDPSKILFSEDFSSYEGLEGEALQAKVKKSWYQTANNMEVITENDDTYLRFPIQALVAGTQYDVPYYAYNDSYAHFLKNNTAYSGIKSYDHETGTLVFAHATDETLDLTVQVDTSTANAAGDMFGTFTYGGTTYKLATGEYAACSRFGDGNCIDRYAHIYFADRTLYTAEDPEVVAGTKKVGDVKIDAPGLISYQTYDKVVVTYKAMIEPDSIGTLNMQLNRFANASTAAGSYNQNFVELGNLNLATGEWTGGALAGATLPIGEWVELYFLVDLKKAEVQGIYDGKVYGIASCGTKGEGGIVLSGWSISKVMKAEPMKLQGAWLIDDVQVLTGDAAGGLIKFANYANDFESSNIGDSAPKFSGLNAIYKVAADPADASNKVLALGNSAEGTGVRDQNGKIAHDLFTSEMNNNFVLSVDYYIPTGAQGQFQTQIYAVNGLKDGAATTKNWNDLFVVYAKDGDGAFVGREAGAKQYAVPYDTWFTVTLEMDMSTYSWDIYVDGSLAMAGQTNAGLDSVTSINGSQIIMCKQNKAADNFLSGYFYIDNITMTAGTYDAAFSAEDVWTDVDDLYADALAIDLTNEEVDLAGVFNKSNSYSFPNSLLFVDADEDFTPDGFELFLTSTAVADDPDTEEDETVAEGNIDKMVRPNHVGISSKKADMAVLSANYFVSEDAEGDIEIQFYDSGWYHIATIKAVSSTINGVEFTKGEEFNVTIVLEFATGTISAYYNNLLIHKATDVACVKNGLSGAEWSVAKVMKDCSSYAGSVIVTDMTITGQLTDEVAESPLYLYKDGEKADILIETVDAASIRLKDPTGLRFAAKVNAALVEGADEVGMIIAPKDYVDAAGAFTTEALDELGYKTNYLKIAAGAYYTGVNSTAELPTSNYHYVTASIVNILDTNIAREFAAIGYYVIDGVTYYADAYTVRSVQAVADAVIESNEFAEDADVMAVLNKYASAN